MLLVRQQFSPRRGKGPHIGAGVDVARVLPHPLLLPPFIFAIPVPVIAHESIRTAQPWPRIPAAIGEHAKPHPSIVGRLPEGISQC